MKQLPLAPIGEPGTFGWWEGRPVLFDAAGLPCTLADVTAGLLQYEARAGELRAVLTEMGAHIAERRAWVDTLRSMGCDQ